MKAISLDERDVLRLVSTASAPAGGGRPSIVLPHGAGRLQFEQFEIAPGVTVVVREGSLDKPLSMSGQDDHGVEIAFQLGTTRRIAIDGLPILAEEQPILSVYAALGGQRFEIIEEPARDAAFVEFSFSPGAAASLCPALGRSLATLLDQAPSVGTARLFSRPLSPAMAETAWRLVRPEVSELSRPLAARRDAFALLGLLTAENLRDPPTDDRNRALQAAEILRSRLADPPELSALANAVGLSPHRLSAAFRGEFDLTPSLFVRAQRMQRAADRLRSGPVPLAGLAWELGYRSTSHFVQAFRAWHGMTPARYARMPGDPEAGSPEAGIPENDILSG